MIEGDAVLVRNHERSRKFEPLFRPVSYKVITVDTETGKIILQDKFGNQLTRHPDDIKLFDPNEEVQDYENHDSAEQDKRYRPSEISYRGETGEGQSYFSNEYTGQINENVPLRRSDRNRKPNPKFF